MSRHAEGPRRGGGRARASAPPRGPGGSEGLAGPDSLSAGRAHSTGRRLRASFALATALLAACRSPSPVDEPSNIVLISIDTLRADRLNAYGYEARVVSPELDRLAAAGILFENHVTASPWTTPAHMSLLTSLSPTGHGVTASFKELMGTLEDGGGFPSLGRGHRTLAERLAKRGWATAAFTGGVTLDPRIGFGRGFSLYTTSMAKLDDSSVPMLIAWIEEHRDRPFFLFWHTFEVHAPYLHGDFVGEVRPAAEADGLRGALAAFQSPSDHLATGWLRRQLEDRSMMTREVCSALYDGGISSVDRHVGRLLRWLDRSGLDDRTLIVVTSDHGEELGEEGGPAGGARRTGRFYNAHGRTLYQEMVRVPLIIRLPGGEGGGSRVRAVSRTIDVAPTILDVLGVAWDGDPAQGASLRPLWEGTETSPRKAVTEAFSVPGEGKSLRSGRYKYVLGFGPRSVRDRGRWFIPARPAHVELYDVEADPGERHDLLVDPTPSNLARAEELDAELRRLVVERRSEPERTLLDPETLEQIKALGYAE